jgi:threonine dehydrogenase-like Zn-dependent dehydrogenase
LRTADNAQRFIFNGADAKPMFNLEDAKLPELKLGEILVKVRAATICLSDIHTVCGNRIEPTPR